jgi:hypothetical protein
LVTRATIYRVWIPGQRKIKRSSHVLFDERAFDVATRDEEETFDPGDFGLLDSGGAYTLAKGVTITKSPAPRIHGATESPGSSTGVETSPTEEAELDIEGEDLESHTPNVGRSNSGSELTRRSGRRAYPSQKARDRENLESQGLKIANKSTGGRKAAMAMESALLSDVNALPERAYMAFAAAVDFTTTTTAKTPQSYAESQQLLEAKQWYQACREELDSLTENDTWQVTAMPVGATLIKGRWVFKIKFDVNGKPERFKARWVVRGFTQKAGVDYDETYAAMVKPVSLKVMLALAAYYGYECKQYDIITVFLNAVIDGRQIFVELPHGFEDYVIQLAGMATTATNQQLACLLLRALYGLKQSPMLWYREFEKFIRNLGFTPLFADACLFRHSNGCIIIIYVDDVLAMALIKAIIESVVSGPLRDAFKLRELGDVGF